MDVNTLHLSAIHERLIDILALSLVQDVTCSERPTTSGINFFVI